MLAEISSGNVDTADVLFLVAFIVFVIAAIAVFVPIRRHSTDAVAGTVATTVPLATVLGYAGLALIALGFLVL